MSNDLTKDEVNAMAQKAGCAWLHEPLAQRFATLCRAPLVAEVERLTADLEQTRVQLAGCGVAAMQNTEESKAHRVERGAYGWSESYGDVCRTVDSEIELRAENTRLKDDYQHACKTVAENAALKQAHEINADTLNAMQVEIDDWKARALKSEQAGEPVAYIAWKNDKPCYEGDDAICEDAVWPVDSDDYRTSMPVFTAPQPAAQEPTSAVTVVRQMVEALERKLPGGKQTDDFESSRIGDYNQGWNDYRKAVKKMFKNINMNSSENSNPDAYLYSLEYGEKVVDTKVSIHQLNYPFGVAGADYLVRNDDGVSYVRQTKLYAALSRALAAGQKFIKENGK